VSVIPINYDETVVSTRTAFDASGGITGKVTLIQNLDNSQLQSNVTGNATYDLRVGPEYRYLSQPQKGEIGEEGEIILQRAASVLIETEESLHLPRTVFGVVLTKVSLTQKGVTNTPSKVDPGYSGPLIITVTNFGREPVKLKRGEKLCSILFLRMESPANAYEGGKKRIIGSDDQTKPRGLRYIIDSYTTYILILNTILILVLFILLLFK
jgi:dCTP deaminase